MNNEIYIHDLSSYAIGMHNCVGRETEFLTTDGVKSFYDFSNGDEIEVLTHTGEIKKQKLKSMDNNNYIELLLKKAVISIKPLELHIIIDGYYKMESLQQN